MLSRGPFMALMVTAVAAGGVTVMRHYEHAGIEQTTPQVAPKPASTPPVQTPLQPAPTPAPSLPPQAAPQTPVQTPAQQPSPPPIVAQQPPASLPPAPQPAPQLSPPQLAPAPPTQQPPVAVTPPALPPAVANAPASPPVTETPEETSPTETPAAPMITPKLADAPKPPPGMEDAAKYMFAAKRTPTKGPSEPIGYYPKGCLQGAVALPVNGPHWQVMRLSRNRNWGTPQLVRFIKNFSERAAKATGWDGILVGDMAQPRGGPAVSGHVSHQTGLDVDIWFIPMPKDILTAQQREDMAANNLVAADWKHINPKVYTPQHMAFIKTAAQMPNVERVLVNAAIKKQMCDTANGDRSWLTKVRPWYGHHDHIHVRLACPPGATECKKQPPVGQGEGCADADFKFWFTKAIEPRKPPVPGTKPKPQKYLKLADLPAACKAVLNAP